MNRLIPLCLLSLCLCMSACRRQEVGADHYTQGMEAMKAHNDDVAIQELQLATAENASLFQAHFALGRLCAANPEGLPLAIWHLRQAAQSPDATVAQTAKSLLAETEKRFLLQLQEHWGKETGQDAELRNQLLLEQNRKLNDWIARLNSENYTLRQMLLN
ncbi:MAG: hypothetical protein J6866_00385 [Victivallales bacterium]|nr:hypothetical protein [Victivallales bacterium]